MKRITLITLLLLIITAGLLASPSFYIQGDFNATYTTNVFSNPLPKNVDNNEWLINKINNPFIKRFDIGGSVSSSLFFSAEGRTGISTKLHIGKPMKATETRPDSENYTDNWNYISQKSTNQKLSVIAGIGPIFRAQLGYFDLGIAIRFNMGTLNLGDSSLIIGIQAEPYLNYFFTPYTFLSVGLTYDAHFMRFIEDEVRYYEEHFFMSSITPFVGLGIKIGARANE